MRPLRIGNLELATPLILAPIAGYCDVSFRVIARACGSVGLAVTDLLSPDGILKQNESTRQLVATCEDDKPLSMQLYGADVDKLCAAARWCEENGADVVDINMGCPVDKVTKRNGGSKLLCDPDNTVRMVEQIKATLKHTPLTAKLRLGWDDSCIVAPSLARRLEEAGCAMITVHGRTTQMKFTGNARLDGIAEVVAACKHIPVIGNGDIKTPQDAVRMFEHTKCAGIMIGRGALSAPWIFRDVWSYLTTGTIPPPPSIEEKCGMMRTHFYNLIQYRSERQAIQEMRKRVSWWAKSMAPSRPLKDPMRDINSVEDFERVVTNYLEWRAIHDEAVRNGRKPWMEDEALLGMGSD
jgi:tRNA-dihydrouridine synthase B